MPIFNGATEATMNADMIKGRWKQWLGRAKHAWSTVTHDDLLAAQSDMLKLSGLLQQRCGEARAQAQRLLNGLDVRARTH